MHMEATIAQGLNGLYQENMLSSRLFYLYDYAREVWKQRAEAIKNGDTYIGGV